MGYNANILLFAILVLWCDSAIAVAPGDQQSQCTTTQGSDPPGLVLVNAYTSRQTPLMDMYWYVLAFGNFGNGVWESIKGSNGHNADGWRRGTNTNCRSTMQARQQGNSNEDNWVATQFISRSTAQLPSYDLPIFVNVTYKFLTCNPRSFELHYYPSVSEPSPSSKNNTANYIHIGDVTATNGDQQTESFSFNLGSQFGGFYLAFRDQDSCASISRVQVYRGTCPQRTEGLVIYPETPAGTAAVPVTHQCVANANVSGSGLMCNPDGSWSGSPSCSCVPGYRTVTATCQVCAAGTYQSGDSCVTCPTNTVTSAEGVTVCSCQNGYYRAPSDPSSAGCTEPPTRVQQLQATQSTNTSITIQWNAPANTGGRSDLVYQISYRRIGSEQIITSTTTQTTHQLTGLQPLSEYRITVVSANGITLGLTDVAAITLDSRTAEITGNTTEGVPGPPAQVNVINGIVIWQPPQTPNGKLLGYTIRIYSAGNVGQAQTIDVGISNLYHELPTSDLPAGDNLQVQVRGKTIIGGGTWSDPQPFSIQTPPSQLCPTPTPPPTPPTPTSCAGNTIITVTASAPVCTCKNIATTVVLTQLVTPAPVSCPSPRIISASCPHSTPSLSCVQPTTQSSDTTYTTTVTVTATPSVPPLTDAEQSAACMTTVWSAVGAVMGVIIVGIILVVVIALCLCCCQQKRSKEFMKKRVEMNNFYDVKSDPS